MNQLFTHESIVEEFWECAHPVYMYFLDLRKAYDHVPWDIILQEYMIPGLLQQAIQYFYNQTESYVFILSRKSNTFPVGVSSHQGCLCLIFHEQDLKAQPAKGTCPVWGSQNRLSSFCRKHGYVGFIRSWPPACTQTIGSCMSNRWEDFQCLQGHGFLLEEGELISLGWEQDVASSGGV